MSNPDKFKDRLIKVLLAELYNKTPVQLGKLLTRMGFKPGDVTFRVTNAGQTWTEINRWPWSKP